MSDIYTQARAWLGECYWGDEPDFSELTDAEVKRGVGRFYDGGWPAFVADSETAP
jgi:hypothetical protein